MRLRYRFLPAFAVGAITFSLAVCSQAQTYNILYTFGAYTGDGLGADGALMFDGAGNLYGTTGGGGNFTNINCANYGCGTVFELSPAVGGGWTETILHSFNWNDGAYPNGSLVMDAAGNLYGTTSGGGPYTCNIGIEYFGCGTIFELSPTSSGTWTETTLYAFTGGLDGDVPGVGLVFDKAGNLYGTTFHGGRSTLGVVFQLAPNGSGGWTENSIYTFRLSTGWGSNAPLVFDSAGNLYGTTVEGGPTTSCANGCGVVYELTPSSSGKWTEKIIHNFNRLNGNASESGLTFDSAGNLYGTTVAGGNVGLCLKAGCGTVFELSPNSNGGWKQTRMFKFVDSNGASPSAGVIIDASGNLYGTTSQGGDLTACSPAVGCGVAYKLTPNPTGWTETVLHRFGTTATDGIQPRSSPIFDSSGNLYGTTSPGTSVPGSPGTVYEITP